MSIHPKTITFYVFVNLFILSITLLQIKFKKYNRLMTNIKVANNYNGKKNNNEKKGVV